MCQPKMGHYCHLISGAYKCNGNALGSYVYGLPTVWTNGNQSNMKQTQGQPVQSTTSETNSVDTSNSSKVLTG